MLAEPSPSSRNRISNREDVARLDFDKHGGLVPQVAQDAYTGEVLMVGYADVAAVEASLEEGEVWFWSRRRQGLWKKGETSGNTLRLVSLHGDCDADALLALVVPSGPTCHTGSRSCFGAPPALPALNDVILDRAREPEGGGYTAKLLHDRNLRLKKLGEEATELAVACADEDPERAAEEAADLIYHALVACRSTGIDIASVLEKLAERLPRPR